MLESLAPYLIDPDDADEALEAAEAALGSILAVQELGQHKKPRRLRQKPGRPERWDRILGGELLWDVWERYTGRQPGRWNWRVTDQEGGPFVAFHSRCLQVLEPGFRGSKQVREMARARRNRRRADDALAKRKRRRRSTTEATAELIHLEADPSFVARLLDRDHRSHGAALRRWHKAVTDSRPSGKKGSTF